MNKVATPVHRPLPFVCWVTSSGGRVNSLELSDRIAIERTQLSRIIDQAESQGYIERTVSEQDRRACELNQRGIRSRAHRQGVLVRQEYWVHAFQSWVRDRLATQPGQAPS